MNKVIEVQNDDACDPESWMTSFGGDGYTYYHFLPKKDEVINKGGRPSKASKIQAEKQALANEVKALAKKKLSVRAIAKELAINKDKVQRILS